MEKTEFVGDVIHLDDRFGFIRFQMPLFVMFKGFGDLVLRILVFEQFNDQVLITGIDFIDVQRMIVGIVKVNDVFVARIQRHDDVDERIDTKGIERTDAVDLKDPNQSTNLFVEGVSLLDSRNGLGSS